VCVARARVVAVRVALRRGADGADGADGGFGVLVRDGVALLVGLADVRGREARSRPEGSVFPPIPDRE
jgi:hypothetical protein